MRNKLVTRMVTKSCQDLENFLKKTESPLFTNQFNYFEMLMLDFISGIFIGSLISVSIFF